MTEAVNTVGAILLPADFHHETVKVGNLSMHVVIEGDENAPPLVLLHGFPEFWYGWRNQIKELAKQYRVIVPDQRGYNLTDKTAPYDVWTLTGDVHNLIRALGYERAVVIGHDWGGIVAWLFAAFYPEMVEKLVILNVPHPMAGFSAFRNLFFPQIARSWYIGFFQIPGVPEALLSAGNFAGMVNLMKEAANITDEEVEYYRRAWMEPGAISAMIGWYRALAANRDRLEKAYTVVHTPTRLIWGTPDVALHKQLAEWSRSWCPNLQIRYVENAGHFVQLTAPEIVNALILEFLNDKGNV
jgi:epoxide hydrolase 4